MINNIGTLTGMPQKFHAADDRSEAPANPAYMAAVKDSYIRPKEGDISGDGFLHMAVNLPDDTELPILQTYFKVRM